jgi:hypothetical protein
MNGAGGPVRALPSPFMHQERTRPRLSRKGSPWVGAAPRRGGTHRNGIGTPFALALYPQLQASTNPIHEHGTSTQRRCPLLPTLCTVTDASQGCRRDSAPLLSHASQGAGGTAAHSLQPPPLPHIPSPMCSRWGAWAVSLPSSRCLGSGMQGQCEARGVGGVCEDRRGSAGTERGTDQWQWQVPKCVSACAARPQRQPSC